MNLHWPHNFVQLAFTFHQFKYKFSLSLLLLFDRWALIAYNVHFGGSVDENWTNEAMEIVHFNLYSFKFSSVLFFSAFSAFFQLTELFKHLTESEQMFVNEDQPGMGVWVVSVLLWRMLPSVSFSQGQWLMLASLYLPKAETCSPLTQDQIHQHDTNTTFPVKSCVCVCACIRVCVASISKPLCISGLWQSLSRLIRFLQLSSFLCQTTL